MDKIETLAEFWPFYLAEHKDVTNRWLHFTGSTFGLIWLALAIVQLNWWLLLIAMLNGYAFAWVGHFIYEKNRPATFKYPLKSFLSDWKMYGYMWAGKLIGEYDKYDIKPYLEKT